MQAAGYKAAFQLFNCDDPVVDPLYMIRRQDIAGPWALENFISAIHRAESGHVFTSWLCPSVAAPTCGSIFPTWFAMLPSLYPLLVLTLIRPRTILSS